ncbi:hypothetical protein P6709_07605 [Jeotgalibacillus sp. ET6]|uniref:hypothetical protein n=1 Tax=Jeotgalibacillus sp. ET6 TaxID=3037260 RepID=UPI0024181D70|nr:hypothetical protein [Jeotgalibacillus sp. ET6]MDG5471611.1 hypothetical protein [Jeotgalibacillus sp. ET6]
MVRNDTYCLYNGKEYRFVHNQAGLYEIVTTDKTIIDASFKLYRNEVYTKQVKLDDLEEVYSITSLAVYNGDVFQVSRSVGADIEIYTTDLKLAEDNKMETFGKSEYIKVVPISDVEMFEEKTLLNIK